VTCHEKSPLIRREMGVNLLHVFFHYGSATVDDVHLMKACVNAMSSGFQPDLRNCALSAYGYCRILHGGNLKKQINAEYFKKC
jgi:hypothetical protein